MLLMAQPIARESARHESSQARPPLSAVPSDERTRALARYKIIQPHVEQGVPLAPLVHQQGIALRTAQRWVALHRPYGLAGLARRVRSDRGQQRG
jgi:putative transposase